ncbi:hypothetical protein PCANC_15566 [Puccinia coronata f. sp. avenae]|uniref:Uncharacterized protein n=1 Tax=Puccinia coronata f. sp. avenae TaxID=200324 RepID=A0A2N5SX65_9BASI|nr:hypothetical protein PCANC_15566 [Puccinia coronata f. sp. avenae]
MKSLKLDQLAEVLAAWEAFDVKALNISSIPARYPSAHFKLLIGKDYKIILQTSPFVLFRFMTDSQRAWWNSLCTLGTFIFQTRIPNMTNYLADLRKHINIFLWNSIHHSAQWVNKPKFHMLLHLPESILRFGPASLFSTGNFESFNGLLRKAFVYSNRLHPGRDLALTFLNFEAHCLILLGSCIWNPQTHANTIAGNDVVHLFKTNGCIKKSMGYNPSLLAASHTFPSPIQLPLTLEAKKFILAELELLPDSQVLQVALLRLSPWDIVAKGYFVLIANGGQTSNPAIAQVQSLWKVQQPSKTSYFVCARVFNIKLCLNVQHDCHAGHCKNINNRGPHKTPGKAAPSAQMIVHANDHVFILNSAALQSSVLHRQLAAVELPPISALSWQTSVTHGIGQWAAGVKARQTRKEQSAGKKQNPLPL